MASRIKARLHELGSYMRIDPAEVRSWIKVAHPEHDQPAALDDSIANLLQQPAGTIETALGAVMEPGK